jgi:hypothetical protein
MQPMKPEYHTMSVQIDNALGKVTFTCPACDRRVETHAGRIEIIRHGDQSARHSGWALPPGVSADGVAEISTESPEILPQGATLQ